MSILGIRRAQLDVLHATDHCLCACHLGHCGGGQYTLQVLYCDVLRCQAAEAGPKYRNACVVCPCERGHAPHWDFYALYDTVGLYVSREFTVPELQLF